MVSPSLRFAVPKPWAPHENHKAFCDGGSQQAPQISKQEPRGGQPARWPGIDGLKDIKSMSGGGFCAGQFWKHAADFIQNGHRGFTGNGLIVF